MIVSKAAIRKWIQLANDRNDRYLRELSRDSMTDAAKVAATVARNFLNSVRDCAEDDQTATHAIESTAFGVMHSASQALLFATPPTFDPPDQQVN